MPLQELFANNFSTSLAVGCAIGDTTIHVNAAAPATLQGGQFRVVIDNEYMIVTGGQSGTTWTVTRGVENSIRTPHQPGAWVTHTLTAGALSQFLIQGFNMLDSPILMEVAPWTNVGAPTVYPASGTYDVSLWQNLGGVLGLQPLVENSLAVAIFRWYSDPAGGEEVGVKGMHISSSIASAALLRLPNQGPYLTITITPYVGSCPLAAHLFGTNRISPIPLLCGDGTLITQGTPGTDKSQLVVPASSNTAIWPDDYYAGPVQFYFTPGASNMKAQLFAYDLVSENWMIGDVTAGGTFEVPFGSWYVNVTNPNAGSQTYGLMAQQSETGG